MKIEDRILIDLHRAADLAGRPGIAMPWRDLIEAKHGSGRQVVAGALKRLARSDRIRPIRKDLVVLPNATGRVIVGLPELIEIVAPAQHLITGARALEVNHLTDQYSYTVVVLVPTPVQGFTHRGEEAVFRTTKPTRIWGWQDDGPHYAAPERAVLDTVSHPRYGVSLNMAIGAMHKAVERNPRFLTQLAKAARRYDSAATARRIGFIVDQLYGQDAAEPFRTLIGNSRSPVPLRPGGSNTGQIDHNWRLIVNASVELEAVDA